MNETKWTPGPWVVQRDSGMYIYITQPHDTKNRVPGYYAEVRRFTSNTKQVEANANLIAAAPELYEALELLVVTNDNGGWPSAALVIARAALEKARGEAGMKQKRNTRQDHGNGKKDG